MSQVRHDPYVIDLRVKSLNALFSELDPSPFRERDLDTRAAEFVEDWASDAPAEAPLVLRVQVKEALQPEATAAETRDAVQYAFEYKADVLRRRLQRNRGRALRWFAVGLTIMTSLLWVHSLVGDTYPDTFMSDIISEALVIAGWVAVWLPIERFGFEGWLMKDDLKLYQRLAAMDVQVVKAGA